MHLSKTKFSCIILAGGEGRRAGGQDKGLIPFDGKPMIEHVIKTIQPHVDEILISANRNISEYESYGHRVITDEKKSFRGPLAGIAASIPLCTHQWILVLPCDMPFIPGDIVEKLFSGKQQSQLCIAKNFERLQLVFMVNKKLLPTIQYALNNNNLKLMHWVKLQTPTIVNFKSEQHFQNYNYNCGIDASVAT